MGSGVSGQPVIARFGRDRITLLIVVLAGLGTAHILVRTATYGAGIDRDATFFLSTALNFLAGEGLAGFHRQAADLMTALVPPVVGGQQLGRHRSAGDGLMGQRHRLWANHPRRGVLAALAS